MNEKPTIDPNQNGKLAIDPTQNGKPIIDPTLNSRNGYNINNLATKIKLVSQAEFFYSSKRFGVLAALPLMVFNGMTTTIGATKILPVFVGASVGVMLSIIYFFTVVLFQVKQEHPLRRFLLICILCMGSIYTSFFAIYDQLSEGQLKYQPATNTVKAHNQFINDLRTSLNQTINNIEKQNPDIAIINRLKKTDDGLMQRRDQTQEDSGRGYIASRQINIENRLLALQSVEDSYEYQLHQDLTRLLQQKEPQLNSYLSVEEFLNSNQSYSALFAQDDSLFRDILLAIETTQGFDSNLVGEQSFQPPNYDDYVRTPTFLVPMEIFLNPNSRRQVSFIIFAITVSIFLEIIPLLLGGILTEYPGKNLIAGNHYPKKQRQTVLGQISVATTKFIENINETLFEIWTALRKPIELTDNRKKEFEFKLSQSMSAVNLTGAKKKEFLFKFYERIELAKPRISLNKKIAVNNNQSSPSWEQNFDIATALIVDIMQDTTVKWLTKSKEEGYYDFVDQKKYEYFITWLLQELNEDKSNSPSDEAHSSMDVTVTYEINQNVDQHSS